MIGLALHVAEPPPRYRIKPPLVVDCSVLAAAVFREEESQALAHQHLLQHELHAPFLLQYELASVALKKFREGFEDESRDGLQRSLEIDVDLHRIEVLEVAALARQYRLSAYDASYLWLAGDICAPLATFDQRLASAAREYLAKLS